jgi:hypothetical protein
VFRRVFVAWSPLCLLPDVVTDVKIITDNPDPAVSSGGPLALCSGRYCGLAILSVALPERGLPDRLAGTWPVPR